MKSWLLDVNVLIGLIDPSCIHHGSAHAWFAALGDAHWATCPLTQNAVLRIVGGRSYPNSPGPPAVVAGLLAQITNLSGHRFWPDDFSLLRSPFVDVSRLLHPEQITDTYLLALAAAHGSRLATFDRRMIIDAVHQGAATLHIIA